MADNKINMPSSGGGLVRYFDEAKSRVSFSPWVVAIVIGVIAVVGIVLYKMGGI